MRFDPQVEVTCDSCGSKIHWSPEYMFNDWSGTSGYYDTSDYAWEKWAIAEGWLVEGERDICPDCAAQ